MKKRRRREDGNPLWEFISGIAGLYVFYVIGLWLTDKAAFWRLFWGNIAVLIIGGALIWWVAKLIARRKQKRLDDLLARLKSADLEEYLKNFINRFGMDKKKGNVWMYRDHAFTWDQLRDLRKILNERGMRLPTESWNDTSFLLRHYIQEKEEKLIRESIAVGPQRFNDLSGADFEGLLFRLFSAMGYTVQKTGRRGDQGCDLVLNKDQVRTIVQAKRYKGSVGNDAVQQATAAQKMYDCGKAVVVASSDFTREALDLAKANGVELIGKARLSELLLQYLKESWG